MFDRDSWPIITESVVESTDSMADSFENRPVGTGLNCHWDVAKTMEAFQEHQSLWEHCQENKTSSVN